MVCIRPNKVGIMVNTGALIFCALLLLGKGVMGAEVPPITPDLFPVDNSPEAAWYWKLLASDFCYQIWVWVTTTGVGIVLGWLKWKGTRKEKATMAVICGVRQCYEEYVRSIKHASLDGKLTDAERKEAVSRASAFAVQYAKNEGFDLFKVYAKDSLPSIVDYVVRRIKGEAGTKSAPLSPPPLPDLEPHSSSGK